MERNRYRVVLLEEKCFKIIQLSQKLPNFLVSLCFMDFEVRGTSAIVLRSGVLSGMEVVLEAVYSVLEYLGIMTSVNVGNSNNHLASSIFSELADKDRNIIFSPWSLFNALAMTYVGARENTALQMSKALGLPSDPKDESTFEAVKGTLESFKALKSVEYVTANKIWVQSGFDLCTDFEKILAKFFQSENGRVDYVKNSEMARLEINAWVEEQTNQKIKDLIASGMIDSLTRLVLTSAVYFKGKWLHAFSKENTRPRDFKVTANKTVQIPMMYMNAKKDMRYYETDQYQTLALPYQGGRLTLNIVLPRDVIGLKPVLGNLLSDQSQLEKCICPAVFRKSIHVTIPQFKFDFDENYNKILQNLNVRDMFSDHVANFSGITDVKPGLKVDAVIQKAFIEVNEEGTEAAAATAVIMVTRCAMPMREMPIIFNADHPFLFFICDMETKLILFMGKVEDPSNN